MPLFTDCGRVRCSRLIQPVWVLHHVLEQRTLYLTDSCPSAEPPHLQMTFSLTALFCVSSLCVALCSTDWLFGECASNHRISCIRLLDFVLEIPNQNTLLSDLVKHNKTFTTWTKPPELQIASLLDVTVFAAGIEGWHAFYRNWIRCKI
jgi:hypothetical protein